MKQTTQTAEAAATKTVGELFTKEQLEKYVENSVDMISQGKPVIDGKKNLAACHFYDTEHGKIGTFCMWIKGTPFKIYVGTETEVNEMKDDFYKMASEGKIAYHMTPKERADLRKKKRKKEKFRKKHG
jgi:hypothetical protein